MKSTVITKRLPHSKGLSYYILCYAKMRVKAGGPFTAMQFWEFRHKRPEQRSHMQKNFDFLVREQYLETDGAQVPRYSLTNLGEHVMITVSNRMWDDRKHRSMIRK